MQDVIGFLCIMAAGRAALYLFAAVVMWTRS